MRSQALQLHPLLFLEPPNCITPVHSPTHTTRCHFTNKTHTHTDMKSSSHCSSLLPWLSSPVQVGRPESGGRLNLSAPLTVIVRQQTHRVTHNFTSSPRPQLGLIDPTWHRGGQWNGEGMCVCVGVCGTAILCRSGTRSGSDCYQEWILRRTDGSLRVCKEYGHLTTL